MQADILRAQQQLTRSTDRGDTSARGNEGADRSLGQPGSVSGEARGADAPAARYGRPQEGSVSATGVHFGTQVRDTLSAAYYGSGLKGAERERLEGAENADIRPRIFFYVDKGNGIRPESGVGAHAHQTELRNLYDVWADPLGLRKANPGASNWERAVMQAGFDGYLSVDPKMGQGFAVLVGKQHTNVPVQPIAAPGATAPAKTEPTELREALMSRELNAIDLGNIPGATLRSGTLIVPADAREAANDELQRIGSDTRFSAERRIDTQITRSGARDSAGAESNDEHDRNFYTDLRRRLHGQRVRPLGGGGAFTPDELAAALTAGRADLRGRGKLVDHPGRDGGQVIRWDAAAGAKDGYLTTAGFANFGGERGIVFAAGLPEIVGGEPTTRDIIQAFAADEAAFAVTFTPNGDGAWRVGIGGPQPGSRTAELLAGHVEDTGVDSYDGSMSLRWKIGHGLSKNLLTEALRRVAMLDGGRTPEFEFDRATGANPGPRDRMSTAARTEAKFSKDRDYKLDIEREERVSGKAARLTPEEVAAIERDGDALGLDGKQIKALLVKARERKKGFPQSEGWAPLEVVGVELDTDTETGLPKPGSEHPKFKKIPYSFNVPPGAKRAPPKRDEAWLAKVADKFEALVLDVYKRAEAGDKNAQTIIAHQTWYRNVAEVLRREYGGHGDLFADLLGATSPNTPVDTNWAFSLDAMQRFLRGDFNDDLARLQKWVDEGKPVHKFPNQHKVRQASGKLYGMNSDKAMRAMLDLWRRIEPGTAPKARNFALNLIGQSNMATIDVWAARMLRRAANAVRGANLPRIPLPAEMGLTGEWNSNGTDVTGAFGFGAAAMERVSRSLKKKGIDIAPPDLQAVAWFTEKELWGSKGWTSTTGEGGSFEERIAATPVDRYIAGWSIQQGERKPSDEQMSLAQARVMAMLSGDDSVLAARAMPTAGLYAGTVERSFDTEWTALRATHDPRMAMAEIARLAAENDQWDIFVSRVVRKDEINANARPGVEIYFKDKRSLDAAMPLLEAFTEKGQDGFTMVVDPRAKGDGEFIGVRLQYVPEISARWDEDARARLLEDGGLEAELEDKAERLDDIVREVEGMDGVAHSALVMYDTVVVGKESYDEFIGSIAADADQEAGSEAWFGRPARQALEGAVARYAGQQQQDDAGRVPDAGGEFQSDDDLPDFSRDRGNGRGRDQGRGGSSRAGQADGGQGAALPGYSVSKAVGSAWGPDPRIASVAEKYAADHGIDYRRQAEYINADSFDAGRAARIAEAYAAMAHAPQDPRVKAAYADLVRQTRAQYDALAEAGYKFWLFDGDTDPYAGNPWAAMRDLRDTQSMAVFATAAGFGSDAAFDAADNPLLAATGLRWPHGAPDGELRPVLVNDLFRAVHDAFGHGLEGAGFRHDGEENAWQAHVRLFTGDAVGAITTETRGQNSWLNFGPNGEKNRSAGLDDTVFADQKTGLLPAWAWTEGRAGDFSGPDTNKQFGDKQAVAYNRDMVALRKQLSVLNSLKNCIGA